MTRSLDTEQDCGGDWSEYEDDLADAIADSLDMDWNSGDGAKAVVRWLNENALRPIPEPPPGESDTPAVPITEPYFALREACQRLIDDYQTSDNHHPDHALVRLDHFQAIQVATAKATGEA